MVDLRGTKRRYRWLSATTAGTVAVALAMVVCGFAGLEAVGYAVATIVGFGMFVLALGIAEALITGVFGIRTEFKVTLGAGIAFFAGGLLGLIIATSLFT